MSVVVNRGRKMASPEGVWLAIFGHRYEPGFAATTLPIITLTAGAQLSENG